MGRFEDRSILSWANHVTIERVRAIGRRLARGYRWRLVGGGRACLGRIRSGQAVAVTAVAGALATAVAACDRSGNAIAAAVDERASAVDRAVRGSVVPCSGCNILFILIDTLRADHLGAYGYTRDTSPNIDALASEGWVFREMVAQSTWTKPGTASLLTGLYPKNHGANTIEDRLADDRILLSEYLQRAGYRTHAFVANGNAGPPFNFDRGFDTYAYFEEERDRIGENTRSDRINEKVVPFLRDLDANEKFFAYIHYVDPHSPYEPGERRYSAANTIDFDVAFFAESRHEDYLADPERLRDLRRQLVAAYDDEIHFNDGSVGELIGVLHDRGLLERTIVVITSDHGEELLERNQLGHTKKPFEEQVRVPWIVRVPGMGHRRVERPVAQIDVLPSLVGLVGIPVPQGLDGRDAFSADEEGADPTFVELESKHLKCNSIRSRTEKLSECERRGPPGIDANGEVSRWFESTARFDFAGSTLEIAIQSFHEPREIDVVANGTLLHTASIHTGRQILRIDLPVPGRNAIVLESRTPCRRPVDLGINHSRRCLAFRLFGASNFDVTDMGVPTMSYYALAEDSGEAVNLYYAEEAAEDVARLARELGDYRAEGSRLAEPGGEAALTESQREVLRALGYAD